VNDDTLHRLLTADGAVRVECVRLSRAWREIRAGRHYAPSARDVLGELSAASVLLAGALKFDGALVLQAQGPGPIRLLVVECTSELALRAAMKGDERVADIGFRELLNADGHGRLSLLLDPRERAPGREPYQGIVPLSGDSAAAALEHYMWHSEQIPTNIHLAADAEVAAGLLVQRLPGSGDEAHEETWRRVQALAATLTRDELLRDPCDAMIRHLFHEVALTALAARPVVARCTCSQEKVNSMLHMLGEAEVESVLVEQGQVTVHCDYCNRAYVFDAPTARSLFAATAGPSAGTQPRTVH
jgi:molecular chaperone Hsp33